MMQSIRFNQQLVLQLKSFLQGFVHLFYPHICLQCAKEELLNSQVICDQCERELPFTLFTSISNNPVEKVFWGRAQIQYASSVLYFTKESIVQQIIFELKYKQNKKAGYLLGKLIAQDILSSIQFNDINYLIPIPISKQKLRERGFNQSRIICEAIVRYGVKASIFDGLKKIKNTTTQTHKDRLQRGSQPNNLFNLTNSPTLKDKHVLIIDDVLTTGATLEAAIYCIQSAKPAMIYISTAAYTSD
jgi:ComF family protein